jgi:hypothetical protein
MPASLDQEYRVSNSEITTFRRCRRKWWISYILHLAPQASPVVGPLALGSRVHKALELYYKGRMGLLEAHQGLIEQTRFELLMEGFDTADLDAEAELGRIMLEGYLEWVATQGLDDGLRVIGTEEILRYPMLGGAVTLIGKLDLRILRLSDNLRLALDFKTAKSFNAFNDVGHMLPQLKTYQLLDKLNWPDSAAQRIEGGVYRLIKKVKRTARAAPPFYQDVTIRHNIYTLRAFWHQLQGVLMDMHTARTALLRGGDSMVHAYPNQTNDCRWQCQFFSICPMFDDGSNVESAITDNYTELDPYTYYHESDMKEGED